MSNPKIDKKEELPEFQPLAPNEALFKITCKANENFEKQQFQAAIADYTKAIELSKFESNPDNQTSYNYFSALLLANRSASYFMTCNYEEALKDAEMASAFRPDWGKSGNNSEFQKSYIKAKMLKENNEMGRDIAQVKGFNLVQNKIFQFATEMKNFIYIIVDKESRNCLIVDACWDAPGIMKIIKKNRLNLVGLIVTHYHFDHVGGTPPPPFDQLRIKVTGLQTLLKKYPSINAFINEHDIPYIMEESNKEINSKQITATSDGYEYQLGFNVKLKFLHTPGHTKGSQCVLVNEKRLLSGDTLFIGNCGRLDLPGADVNSMYDTLQKKLSSLDENIVVLPGHQYGGDLTTIKDEKLCGVLKHQDYRTFIKKKL